jgi:hypothetical protein
MCLALAGLAIASVLAVLVPDGLLVVAPRVLARMCGGLVLPFAIGATYGIFGATTATWPALATLNGPTGSPWPAFAVCAIAAAVAWATSRAMPDLPGAAARHRPTMVAVALFSFGVVAAVAALIHVGTGFDMIRLGMLALGIVFMGLSLVPRIPSADGLGSMGVDLRPVAIALAIGVVVGFAAAGPMLQLPQSFTISEGSDPLLALLAMAPFVIALLLAGPVSGWLLQP